MNNRFKFRFWDKDRKIMIDENSDIEYIANIYGRDEWWCIEAKMPKILGYFDTECFATMQCTGLKDKNGKLIYEGDIVNYDDRDLDPWHTPILNAVIEMRKYQWCMVYYRKDIINADTRKPAEQKTWLGFDDFISSRIEVIGNIYENKDLLDERN